MEECWGWGDHNFGDRKVVIELLCDVAFDDLAPVIAGVSAEVEVDILEEGECDGGTTGVEDRDLFGEGGVARATVAAAEGEECFELQAVSIGVERAVEI